MRYWRFLLIIVGFVLGVAFLICALMSDADVTSNRIFTAYVKGMQESIIHLDEIELVYPRTERAKELGLCLDSDIDVPDIYNPDVYNQSYSIASDILCERVSFREEHGGMAQVSVSEFFNRGNDAVNYYYYDTEVIVAEIEITDGLVSRVSELYNPMGWY